MSRRTRACLTPVVWAALCCEVFIAHAFAAPSSRDIERNQINGGNDSINVIATGGSKVLVFRENETKIRVMAADVVREIRKTDPELFADANETIPNQSPKLVEDLALAKYVFEKGQYSLSASLFEEVVSKFDKEDIGYNAVEGLVNASYFGSGRHIQGLQFICRQYASRPSWSFRFRHDIHAHLRALAKKFGHDYAREVLHSIRKDPRCQRDDFTEVWIPIHLHDMRALEQSKVPQNTPYGFTDDDVEFANQLLREKHHGFIDYIYFISGDYDEIIYKFPNSYLYDLALLGKGAAAEGDEAINALETFIDSYKESVHREYAIKLLLRKAVETENKSKIDETLSKHQYVIFKDLSPAAPPLSGEELIMLEAYEKECVQYKDQLESLNLRPLLDSLAGIDRKFSQLYGRDYREPIRERGIESWAYTCGIEAMDSANIRNVIGILASLDRALSSNDFDFVEKIARRVKRCGDIREFLDESHLNQEEQWFCEAMIVLFGDIISFHRMASNMFMYLYDHDDEKFHSLLFLAGLANKHNDDFKSFLGMMQRYAFDHPDKEFADDALTEIGWYYLVIERKPEKADRFLERVLDSYDQTNSFDNALNWLVISKRNQGDYNAALGYATKLVTYISSTRLFDKISGRHEKLREIAEAFDTERSKISVGTFWAQWSIWGVEPPLAIVRRNELGDASSLVEGSSITEVDGIEIDSSDHFYLLLNQMIVEGSTHITVRFTPPGSWEREEERVDLASFGWKN